MSRDAVVDVDGIDCEDNGIMAKVRQTSTACLTGYQEYSFPRLFVPWNIRSHDGTFVLRTIRSLEHSFPGPFVPWNFFSRDRSFPKYTFNRGRSENGERAGVERRRGEGKENVQGMTEGRG